MGTASDLDALAGSVDSVLSFRKTSTSQRAGHSQWLAIPLCSTMVCPTATAMAWLMWATLAMSIGKGQEIFGCLVAPGLH